MQESRLLPEVTDLKLYTDVPKKLVLVVFTSFPPCNSVQFLESPVCAQAATKVMLYTVHSTSTTEIIK